MINQHAPCDDATTPDAPEQGPAHDDDVADTAVRLPRIGASHVASLVVGLMAGGIVYSVPGLIERNGPAPNGAPWVSDTDMVVQFVLILLLLPLVTAIHESGHLAAGRLMGYQFVQLIIGPITISRQQRHVRVAVTRRFFGGAVVVVPPDDRDLRRKRVMIVAAGPLVNLLLATALGALFLAVTPPGHHRVPAVPILLCITLGQAAGFSFMTFLANSLPWSVGGRRTDGQQIVSLLRGGPRMRAELALTALQGQALTKRPRDWDATLVQRATQDADSAPQATSAAILTYLWALDSGHIAEAARSLACALDDQTAPPPLRAFVLIEASFFSAFFDRDPHKARSLWSQLPTGVGERHMRLRAEAAVLLAEGHAAAAQRCAQMGLEAWSVRTTPGPAVEDEEWLRAILGHAGKAVSQ